MSQFQSGAVRDAMKGKGTPSRIPPCALRSLAKRFEDGAAKYPDDVDGKPNWMKGIPLGRYLDSINRHTLQIAEGDDTEDHFGAVLWNVACMQWTMCEIKAGRLPEELNDLPFYHAATDVRKWQQKQKRTAAHEAGDSNGTQASQKA